MQKLRKVLIQEIDYAFAIMTRKEPETCKSVFFKEHGHFLKGRLCKDYKFRDQLSNSLYFEPSKTMNEELSRVVTHQLATDP
jgi:HSP90 family molecular chaperone